MRSDNSEIASFGNRYEPPAPLARYAVAIISVLLMVAARYLLNPWLNDRAQLVLLLPAVLFSAWYGGIGPSLFALGLTAIAAFFLLTPPHRTFGIEETSDLFALAVYLAAGLSMSFIAESQRAARRNSEINAEKAHIRQQQMQVEMSQRRKAMDALGRSEKLLAQAQEIAHLGSWEWIPSTSEIRWSNQMYQIFNINPDNFTLTHESVMHLVHPEDRAVLQKAIQGTLESGKPLSIEHRIITPDGSERVIMTQAEITSGSQEYSDRLIGASLDVTSHKQAEEALKEAGERAQRYLDIAGVMLVSIARDQTVTLINKQGCARLGYPQHELLGKNWFDMCIPEREREEVRAAFAQLMQGEYKPVEYFENAIITHSGEERIINWHNVLLRDTTGAITGTLSSGEDITERKRTEEERLALLAQIQQSADRERRFMREVLSSVTEGRLRLCDSEDDLPSPLSDNAVKEPLTADSLRTFRRHIQEMAQGHGMSPERWEDLVAAAGEAAMNAVVHGGGGTAHLYARQGFAVQVWIEDKGPGIALDTLPRATLERGYTTAGTLGHGFWLMVKMADRVWLLTQATGTTVVLEQYCKRPEPAWLHV